MAKKQYTLIEFFVEHPYINISEFAKHMEIKAPLFKRYLAGSQIPGAVRLEKIEYTINEIGKQLINIELVTPEYKAGFDNVLKAAVKKQTMTPKELCDYILTQMPAEEALLRLLSTTVEKYYSVTATESAALEAAGEDWSPIFAIVAVAKEMGWHIAIPTQEGDIQGIAVGTMEYLNENIK